MTELQLTNWFDGAQSPTHPGVYRREFPAGPYACWDGSGWHSDAATADEAAAQTAFSDHPSAPWRGLSRPSSKPCLTCRGHTVIDRGVDEESGRDLIEECPDC